MENQKRPEQIWIDNVKKELDCTDNYCKLKRRPITDRLSHRMLIFLYPRRQQRHYVFTSPVPLYVLMSVQSRQWLAALVVGQPRWT